MNIPLFAQNDINWKNEKLGFSTSSIGLYGCLVTSYAILASYYGKNINPLQMNQLFKDNDCFVNGSYIKSNNVLSIVFPDIRFDSVTYLDGVTVTDKHINEIIRNIDDGYPVIVKIKTPGGTDHYMVACDYDNGLIVVDPADGKRRRMSEKYGEDKNILLRYIIYKGNINKPMKINAGVVVNMNGKYNASIGLADVVEQRNNFTETHIKAGGWFDQWVPTHELEIVEQRSELAKMIEKLNSEIKKQTENLTKVNAELEKSIENGETLAEELEASLEAFDDIVNKLSVISTKTS